jgi:GDP-L-fucose synthase
MHILVTGASGFLGRFLCKELLAQGHELVQLDSKKADLTKEQALEPYQDLRFDQIYHLAAWTQAGDFCLHHPGEQWLINQKINTHVLSWWQQRQPQAKMICLGTSCGYDPTYPLQEENYLRGEPIPSLFSYAMTKRMLLCGLMALHQQFGLEYLYLIPSTLYGPHYHTDGRQAHFIFDLVRKISRGARYGDPVVLWGDGEQRRELVHVRDFVTLALELVRTQKNRWINIGSGEEVAIRDFAKKICAHLDYPFSQIQFDLSKYVGAKSKVLSIDTLKTLIPHHRAVPLDEGIQEVVEWYAKQ